MKKVNITLLIDDSRLHPQEGVEAFLSDLLNENEFIHDWGYKSFDKSGLNEDIQDYNEIDYDNAFMYEEGDFLKPIPMRILAVDSHNGIYSPQMFLKTYITFITPETRPKQEVLDDVFNGPDMEFYWDSWALIMDTCVFAFPKSLNPDQRFRIDQPEDIWLVEIID